MLRNFLIVWLTVVFAGCASVERPGPAEPEQGEKASREDAAYEALTAGDFQKAAGHFARLAAETEPPQRHDYELKAAEALLQADLLSQAGQMLNGLDRAELSRRQAMKVQLLRADKAMRQHDPEKALSVLSAPSASEKQGDLHAQYHGLRAGAFARLGNHLEAARELVDRGAFLNAPIQVKANQTAIWAALSKLSDSKLDRLRTAPPPDVFSGWVALVRIATDIRLETERLEARLDQWQERYPDHPAAETFAKSLVERSRKLVLRPQRIALILPLTGRFASAGAAVRDGVLSGFYNDGREKAATIRVYDTGANPKNVLSVYDRALDDGAEFVIGPLRKEAVNTLAQSEDFPVPTLALNFADVYFRQSDNFFQFALSPEDEARQVAVHTWLDGHGRAALFVPDGEWGERIRRAYTERWDELGGEVVTTRTYSPGNSDFSSPIQAMLNLDDSHRRYRSLVETIGKRLEFAPRGRQDVDLIFMGAFPRQARLIRPQFRFHHASHIPVYATSHVFSANRDAEQDRDMDGVVFGDMPWTLETETPYEELRQKSKKHLTDHGPGLQRLLALGVDAYHLIPKLRLLDEYGYERFQGETGSLHVDEGNHVRRQLVWARFVGGIPRMLEEGQLAAP